MTQNTVSIFYITRSIALSWPDISCGAPDVIAVKANLGLSDLVQETGGLGRKVGAGGSLNLAPA